MSSSRRLAELFTSLTASPFQKLNQQLLQKNQQVTVSSRRHQSSGSVGGRPEFNWSFTFTGFIHSHQNKNVKTLSVWIQPETRTEQMKTSDLKEPNCWFQTVKSWTSRPPAEIQSSAIKDLKFILVLFNFQVWTLSSPSFSRCRPLVLCRQTKNSQQKL